MTLIRTGIVGYGLAGRHFHMPFLRALPQYEIRAVATTRPQAQVDLPAARIVTEAEALFEADDLDLIVIATPHRLHVPQTLAALEAGKHVVVEKPAATTSAEIRQLIDAAESAGRLVIPFQNRRWDGDFLAIKKLLRSGTLGRVHHFETHWPMFRPQPRGVWRDDPGELGGILNDLGPHLIDQTLQLFGMPQSLSAQVMIHRTGCTVDDAFRLHLHYANGLYALLETDVLNGGTVPRYAIRGSNGTFEKLGVDPQEGLLRAGIFPGQAQWSMPAEKARIVTGGENGMTIQGEMEIAAGDYRQFYAGVAAAVDGNAPAPVTLEEVLQQMRILEAARHSSATNMPVSLEQA